MTTTREAFIDWKRRSGMTSFAHHRVQAIYHSRHITLGVLLMIATTVTGSSSFIELGESQPVLNIFIILFTISAGVLAGIQTFLDYKTLGEQHKSAASGWEDLRWYIETIIAQTPDDEDIPNDELSKVQDMASRLRKQSPTIHNKYWDNARKMFEPSPID